MRRHKTPSSLALVDIRRRQREMTESEVDEAIVKTILTAIAERGMLQDSDIKRAEVLPELLTKDRIKRCLAIAEEREPRLRHMRQEAA